MSTGELDFVSLRVMNRLLTPTLFAFTIWLATSSASRADQILIGNLPSNEQAQGLVSSGTQRAVSFTTSGTAFNVSSVTFTLINYISSTDTAIVTFRLDDGSDAPSATVFASLTAPVSESNSAGNFVFTPISAITMAGNTKYWLVIAAGSETETFSWMRSNPVEEPTGTATFGSQEISENGGATWQAGDSGAHSFQVNGSAVPEPSTVALVGLGAGAVLLAHRRRRRS